MSKLVNCNFRVRIQKPKTLPIRPCEHRGRSYLQILWPMSKRLAYDIYDNESRYKLGLLIVRKGDKEIERA
jgi:hypothetical protein